MREYREGVHPAMIPPHRFLPSFLPPRAPSSLHCHDVTLTRRVKLKAAGVAFHLRGVTNFLPRFTSRRSYTPGVPRIKSESENERSERSLAVGRSISTAVQHALVNDVYANGDAAPLHEGTFARSVRTLMWDE